MTGLTFRAEIVRPPKPGDEQVSMPAISNRFVRSFPGMPETGGVSLSRTIRKLWKPSVGGGLMDGHGILGNHVSTRSFPRPMKP